ncbi:ImmA/IrrE family metallo-endopeptidase [Kribbella sp. C-35]|uniref:ImmA/IrrE family metallo-endopeptidase n=1 Tax=Kribbella sp. C-35 TaxID=2789276 RepID=UPI00397B2372
MGFARGFKAEAERTAEDTRSELGLTNLQPINAHELAEHLSIPVWRLSDLHRRVDTAEHDGLEDAIASLSTPRGSPLSAMTVFRGRKRVIVHNDAAEPGRQLSNLTHELAHGILMHDPVPAIDERGCRNWKSDIEDEAAYLGGALIITGKGARWIAKAGLTHEDAARKFGCSEEMVRWRVNMSGGRKMFKR